MECLEFFDTYLEWLDDTECPQLYHRWSLISAVSTVLGRRLVFGEGTPLTVYPNQYICLVGSPASRKNVAIKCAKELLKESGYENFAADRSSKEQFILDMQENFAENSGDTGYDALDRDFDFEPDTEILINAPELQDFLGMGSMDFISWLTNMWDMPSHYQHKLKNSKSTLLVKPTINMIGGATPKNLCSIFPEAVMGQGFLSRAVLIFGKGKRKHITFPTKPDEDAKLILSARLAEIRNSCTGEAWFTPDAQKLMDKIYKSFKPLQDTRLEDYAGRRFTTLIKLCMIVAAADLSIEKGVKMTEEHCLYANTMLTYTEGFMSRALGAFGKNHSLEQQNKILNLLELHPEGMELKQIREAMHSDVESAHQLSSMLVSLKELGRLTMIKTEEKTKFILTDVGPQETDYTDFSLLPEAREFFGMDEIETNFKPQGETNAT